MVSRVPAKKKGLQSYFMSTEEKNISSETTTVEGADQIDLVAKKWIQAQTEKEVV